MPTGGAMPLTPVGMPQIVRRRWISSDAAIGVVFALTFLVTAFLIVTPLASLLYGSFRTGGPGTHAAYTLKNWLDLTSSGVIGTLITTCVIAVLTAVISTACGGMMAWLIYRTDFRYKRLLVASIGLSFFFPDSSWRWPG